MQVVDEREERVLRRGDGSAARHDETVRLKNDDGGERGQAEIEKNEQNAGH